MGSWLLLSGNCSRKTLCSENDTGSSGVRRMKQSRTSMRSPESTSPILAA